MKNNINICKYANNKLVLRRNIINITIKLIELIIVILLHNKFKNVITYLIALYYTFINCYGIAVILLTFKDINKSVYKKVNNSYTIEWVIENRKNLRYVVTEPKFHFCTLINEYVFGYCKVYNENTKGISIKFYIVIPRIFKGE